MNDEQLSEMVSELNRGAELIDTSETDYEKLPGAAIISRVGRALAEAGGKELLEQAHAKVDPQFQRTIDLQWYGLADTNGNQWLP
ncbi:hypothetical protein PhaeoP83_04443 (plasmid) [Phaeobacter inhibens]|uniref:Uncharacterized protein n=2 Tax=Phaeobacter TaxID=302485 RepID=A0AAN1GVR1_9RHOB|nr:MULTISPECIES: hypothetical protein [Phaeobacter]OED50826.1 hypothetical protein AB838_00635 [Rhodobacteraceae bacterium (ex Bugula neritina AB1)]ATG46048.1 hypothetical protein PhaeoP13_04166 [Phaeobacter piscinae]AUQ52661.1 hypothetical protein PhaeoP83_04443 [Phaeobacter inhibens]AUQ56862.1 hypothetical protein PhaeoP92_04246 [Phaeobacter inhibens]AUQ68842.1 hypothetical protein PhaeoP78_04026 [Phaeobacter inhibens]